MFFRAAAYLKAPKGIKDSAKMRISERKEKYFFLFSKREHFRPKVKPREIQNKSKFI
jgi:hypothetical protein